MNTPYDLITDADKAIVYVREVKAIDLPRDLRKAIGEADIVYAVHNSDGERLALVRDRNMAFALARQNDMMPVPAH
ncbi:MAG: DUF1150 family protein [Pseudomonadota bacterium]